MASYAIVDSPAGRVGPARVFYVSRDLRDTSEALYDLRMVPALDEYCLEIVEITDEQAEHILSEITI